MVKKPTLAPSCLGLAWAVWSIPFWLPSLWRSPGPPVCLALFSLRDLMSSRRQLQASLLVASQAPLAFSLPPCTRASSLAPRTLDERPGPLSQEIGFISPAHLAALKGHMRDEAQPLSDTAPSASPLLPTSPLPLTEHPLGARHFTHMLLACFHHKPARQGFTLVFVFTSKKTCPRAQGHTSTGTQTLTSPQLHISS